MSLTAHVHRQLDTPPIAERNARVNFYLQLNSHISKNPLETEAGDIKPDVSIFGPGVPVFGSFSSYKHLLSYLPRRARRNLVLSSILHKSTLGAGL